LNGDAPRARAYGLRRRALDRRHARCSPPRAPTTCSALRRVTPATRSQGRARSVLDFVRARPVRPTPTHPGRRRSDGTASRRIAGHGSAGVRARRACRDDLDTAIRAWRAWRRAAPRARGP
jgi:hypothetical protein